MEKKPEINITELLATAGQNLEIMRQLLTANKLAAEKGKDRHKIELFRDMLTITEQLQIVQFALNMASENHSGDIIKGGVFKPNVGGSFPGQLMDALAGKIQDGDTLQSFAARELVNIVETVHTFQLDSGEIVDVEGTISELVLKNENPHTVLMPSILHVIGEAEKTESFSRLLSLNDYQGDKQAFVGAAMGYQHAVNLLAITPDVIKRLESYKAA